MEMYRKPASAEQDLKWANIWFGQFARFHQRAGDAQWEFSAQHVIEFLRFKRDAGVPAWKRIKIIVGLAHYRQRVQNRSADDLKPLWTKMSEIIRLERARGEGYDHIDEAAGKIDPREGDAIGEFRRAIRKAGLSLKTERAYVGKVKAFMAARGLTCLEDFAKITSVDVEAHLTDLAVDGDVAASTQNGAFHGLLSFFTLVLKREMGEIQAIRATKGKQIPTVLSPPEVESVLGELNGVHLSIAQLLYGCGMRISEAVRLRIKDVDFENQLIQIHQSKGGKSRIVPMPDGLVEPLKRWVQSRAALHEQDLAEGTASVWLPHALDKKYPSAHRELRWQYLFVSSRLSRDPRTGRLHRHHLHHDTFPKRLRQAVESTGILKHVTSHTFRHCFATHLLHSGTDIRKIQRLLGHADVKTTEIYTHVPDPKQLDVVSPLDRLNVRQRPTVRETTAVYECCVA